MKIFRCPTKSTTVNYGNISKGCYQLINVDSIVVLNTVLIIEPVTITDPIAAYIIVVTVDVDNDIAKPITADYIFVFVDVDRIIFCLCCCYS